MKSIAASLLIVAAACICSARTSAQGTAPAEAVPPATPAPVLRATPSAEEKERSKVARKEEGRTVAKSHPNAYQLQNPYRTQKVSKAEREKARAIRKAETARANRAGEIPSGEAAYR